MKYLVGMVSDVLGALTGLVLLICAFLWLVLWGACGLLMLVFIRIAQGDNQAGRALYAQLAFGPIEWISRTFYESSENKRT